MDWGTSQRAGAGGADGESGSMPPPRTAETQNVLSFEGSTEEVLRYTIVAKVRFRTLFFSVIVVRRDS